MDSGNINLVDLVDSLGTFGLLAYVITALLKGWLITPGRFADAQAAMAREVAAAQAAAQTAIELAERRANERVVAAEESAKQQVSLISQRITDWQGIADNERNEKREALKIVELITNDFEALSDSVTSNSAKLISVIELQEAAKGRKPARASV